MRHREQHDSADQKQGLPRELRQIVAEHRLQHRGIGRQPAGELSRSSLGEESGRQADQVREQLLPQLRYHQLRSRREQVDLHEVEHGLNREQYEKPDRYRIEQRRIRRHERRIQEVPYDLRKRERDRGAEQQAHEREQQSARIRPYARQKPSQRAG
jgi:hypothetical protein